MEKVWPCKIGVVQLLMVGRGRWKIGDQVLGTLFSLLDSAFKSNRCSSKVIDSLSHDIFTVAGTHNVGLTYFYFDYKNQERQEPKYLLKALIRQLAGQVPVFRPYIEGLYLQCEGRAASLELSDLFYCFDAICRDFDHAFVVLDALNEIESSKRISLFENVLERMFTSTSVKLFITSRPGSIPASFMSNVQLVHMDGNTGDIQKYLDQKIDSRMFPGLHDAIRKEILSNANGMYIVIQFVRY